MEFKLKEFKLKETKEPFLCLNMIVKNESHIIESTLENIVNKLKIDYWVISDTGSTDDTREKIRNFFDSRNIPGELYDDEWRDFAYNRTKALEYAFGKSKYVFIFDADDELHGEIILPVIKDSEGNDTLEKDAYHFNFGSSNGINYTRVLLVNNKIQWRYLGVLHEFIDCMGKPFTNGFLNGQYYTVSGRKGNRSKDVNKYLNDAIILEKAHAEAVKNNDPLYNRYAFYCANSYFDFGKYEDAIKWYKITLSQNNWDQEKYMSCLKLFYCYRNIQQQETGMFYLIQSWLYDQQRVECIYELIAYYCANNMPIIAYNYYQLIKKFFEEDYLKMNMNDKLFLESVKYNLLLPYYVILVADKVQNYDTVLKMFRTIFIKKFRDFNKFYIGNVLYNLQFFIDKVDKNDREFFHLFKEYINFLLSIGYSFKDHNFMNVFEKYGIYVHLDNTPVFTKEQCEQSNKILVYTGLSGGITWNYSYSIQNALGGSETAVAYLTKCFPNNYEIYVAGDVQEEKHDNITYVNNVNLKKLIDSTAFYSIIVSRYISFYEIYSNFSAYNTFIWAHDIVLLPYGCDTSVDGILNTWNNKITGCICQTNWHKNLFLTRYPTLKDKLYVINNGIKLDLFNFNNNKVSNRFMYSSCVERGLDKLLDLWPQILVNLPDAELFICTYNNFPRNNEETKLLDTMNKLKNIKIMGKLDKSKLYELMSTTEYWLYPTNFNETSCITSMEMLMSEVICLYYPLAGLTDTLGDYGIKISQGNEIDTLLNLTTKQKINIRKRGKEYAISCSWDNRAKEWISILNNNNKIFEPVKKNNSCTEEQNNTKIINLIKRKDRKNFMTLQLEREKIDNYEFIEAVDGKTIEATEELRLLFERNDFNYKKGVIGVALSHLHLFNMLINDNNNDYYVIFEDDVYLCDGFKEKLKVVCDLFEQQQLEHLALGEYNTSTPINVDSKKLTILTKDNYKIWNVAFAYIISKKCAKNIISYVNKCPIKCAIDNQQCSGSIVNYYCLNENIVSCKFFNSEFGSDIQVDTGCFHFLKNANDDKIDITIAFCDWWITEYCGGTFDLNYNFITDILRKYGNISKITIVRPNEKPDILFYSIFGNYHKNINNCRKVFFSGEPFGIRQDADFNVSFDKNSNENVRLPLWVCYLNDYLMEECKRRKNGNITVPKRDKFCSFIAAGEVKTTHRRTIVEKLSKYKMVDCGGNYLNNIGFTVPRGVNCSGKIEHNKNYKFAIAFENEDYPGYVTEKICDVYKSNCIPIYWGTTEVVKDFNPSTFINARDFDNFDELVEYIIKVDNDDDLYASYFKEPFFSDYWLDIFNDPNKTFYKNLADLMIGKKSNLYYNYVNIIEKSNCDNSNCDNSNNNSIDNSKETWVLFGIPHTYNLVLDFINNLRTRYNIIYATHFDEIKRFNPSKILVINTIHDSNIFNVFKDVEISILNIDSLYIPYFLNNIFLMTNLYPNIKVYDYSKKNIEVLNKHNIHNEYLEYVYDEKEVLELKKINEQPKLYDFGIIGYTPELPIRRKNIVQQLRNKGFSVFIVCGFGKKRDFDLGKCKIILNIHQQSFNVECRTFEHLRCNRLLFAGFNILSENSYVDDDFISKFTNIKFIDYDDFKNIKREQFDDFNSIGTCNINKFTYNKNVNVFNIWHNKLFDNCYEKLDDYSLSKIKMFDVNPNYQKIYNKDKGYNIVKEYELKSYNSLFQLTNYCQTSCLYHVFKNQLYEHTDYIGFIQYDMKLEKEFITDIEEKINSSKNDIFFYNLTEKRKIHHKHMCNPYENSILEKYNKYFNTNHTYESIKENEKSNMFICLHTFVIPTKTFIKMMTWYSYIKDWLHANYISGLYVQSMSETTEEIFGLFLLLQIIEDDSINMELLKLHHDWEKLHFSTEFINYKNPVHYFSLDKIVDSRFTDKNTCHSYLDTYEKLMKYKHLTCKNVLEIGDQQGGSLKLWHDYFVNANIYGINIQVKVVPDLINDLERVHFLKMNAYSKESVEYFLNKKITFDFIIDDGDHSIESMIYFIENYTNLLSSDGILIIEDVQDIKLCEILKRHVPPGYNYEIVDLRYIKNRWDDILFIVKPIKMLIFDT